MRNYCFVFNVFMLVFVSFFLSFFFLSFFSFCLSFIFFLSILHFHLFPFFPSLASFLALPIIIFLFSPGWDPYGEVKTMLNNLKLQDLFVKFQDNCIRVRTNQHSMCQSVVHPLAHCGLIFCPVYALHVCR